jgi:cell division protein ZapE
MPQTLPEIYDTAVAAQGLRADPAQRALMARLDPLRATVEAVPVRRKSGLAGLLRRGAPPPPAPRGLYLWGGVGRGKSMLMDLFFSAVATDAKRRVHFHAFMQEIHAGMHKARARGVDDALAPVAADLAEGVRLLCFDEMQITDITDAMIVGRLFQMLFDAGVAIVTTSNRPPDDLYKDGLNRALFLPFIALLKDRLDVVELQGGTDYRQNRLEGRQMFFSPADADARAAMDALWSDLTRDAPEHPLELQVQGRKVVLPHFAAGVARAEFWDLCGKPLGPADYLAVAGAVRVLMLDAIPRLSRQNFNEAKRFVTLIDTLYEARVRLVASAADIPERLYVEGAGAFEFERTASRLREMQAADWGEDADSRGDTEA